MLTNKTQDGLMARVIVFFKVMFEPVIWEFGFAGTGFMDCLPTWKLTCPCGSNLLMIAKG
jgi:hypothetical protein